MASMVVLLAMASLCVDFGLRTLVDAEVQAAADAAAKAGCDRLAHLPTALSDEDAAYALDQVRAAAIACGESNPTTGDALRIAAADVELGTWDARTRAFTPTAAPGADAVRVTVERSAARGNPIRTSIGRALGVDRLASRRRAVARLDMPPPGYALVGLDAFRSMGVLTVDGSPWYRRGSIASNGDVTVNTLNLVGISLIDGHVATGGDVRVPSLLPCLTTIRDGVRRPAQPFVLPAVSAEAATIVNDNGLLGGLLSGSGDLTVVGVGNLAPGVYCVDDLTVLAGAVLRVNGAVTIYVRGRVSILGTVLALGDPDRFRIRVVGAGPVFVAANVTLSADVYAPAAQVWIAAGVVYHGRLVARRIDILGTSVFFLRPDLPAPALGRERVTLVT